MTEAAAMSMQTSIRHNALLGRPVAAEITAAVKAGVADLDSRGWPVKLVSITIGDVPAVSLYVRNQARGAEKAGIRFRNATCRRRSRGSRC